MEPEIYASYISYDIQKYFRRAPDGPTRCLMCTGDLEQSALGPSRAMRNEIANNPRYTLLYGSSWLFMCNACRWWCIREGYEFADTGCAHRCGDDYLIVGTAKNHEMNASRNTPIQDTHPWLKALDDPKVYEKIQVLPKELAVLFEGDMTREQD